MIEPTYEPRIYASSPLNGTYLVFFVDSNYNSSARVPAELLWIASGVTFSQTPTAVIGQNGSVYGAITSNSSRVPYLTPTVPGHTYIALIYNSPPNFEFPPNFPYNATVRTGFNVTRIGADFHSPALEATYFTIRGNGSATASPSEGGPHPTGTGGHGRGYVLIASVKRLIGSANSIKVEERRWTGTPSTIATTVAYIKGSSMSVNT